MYAHPHEHTSRAQHGKGPSMNPETRPEQKKEVTPKTEPVFRVKVKSSIKGGIRRIQTCK
jgi:hypothetical protein